MSKFLLPLLLLLILQAFPPVLCTQDLEIHYINVQWGQSTLIVGPDGTTILYDGGSITKGYSRVIPYLQSLGIDTSKPLDYIIASHRHGDHYLGLIEVINYGYDTYTIFDNGSIETDFLFNEFLDAAFCTSAGGVVPMPLGCVIDLGKGATATCIAVNGAVLGVGAIPGGQENENDRSVCLLIQYGDFDFIMTGDVGGGMDDYHDTGRVSTQANVETPLVQAIMPGGAYPMLSSYGVEIAHVGHHGSESSTNIDYMNILTPTVAPISVGSGQGTGWHLPRKNVIQNVLQARSSGVTAQPSLVLQTNEGSPAGKNTCYSGYCVGDIVITTDGIQNYGIRATGHLNQGPDERVSAGLPGTFNLDEYDAIDFPPVIYNIKVKNVDLNSIEISWTTNEPAMSVVEYRALNTTDNKSISQSSALLNHRFVLRNLDCNTLYCYIIYSKDLTNNTRSYKNFLEIPWLEEKPDSPVEKSPGVYKVIK